MLRIAGVRRSGHIGRLPTLKRASLGFDWPNAQKSPLIRSFLYVLQSLRFQDSNQNCQIGPEVSRAFLGNGRFAESKSGDWFDLSLSRTDLDAVEAVDSHSNAKRV